MCVWNGRVEQGYMPLPTRPRRYCNAAFLVRISVVAIVVGDVVVDVGDIKSGAGTDKVRYHDEIRCQVL